MFGHRRIEIAATDKVDELRPEVDELLLAIGKYMIEPGDLVAEWAASALITDESSLFDFLMEEDIEALRRDLGLVSLSGHDLVWVVAQTMRNMKRQYQWKL